MPYCVFVFLSGEEVSPDGERYKEITSVKSFTSYEDAEAYVSQQGDENYKIVGDNPFISPVPLEALEHYKLIYRSDSVIEQQGVGIFPSIKIFEYTH